MSFTVEITNKKRNKIILNEEDVLLKEIQRNRLNLNTMETKFVFIFSDFEHFKEFGEPLIMENFNSFKVTNTAGDILFERDDIPQENISIFSNQTTTEINMHIVIFETIG